MDFSLPPEHEDQPSAVPEDSSSRAGYLPPPASPGNSHSQLEDLFSRSNVEPHSGGYSVASPSAVVPPSPNWNLPPSTQESVDRAIAGGYEVGASIDTPYTPAPSHFAPPPHNYEQPQPHLLGAPVDAYGATRSAERPTWTVPSPGSPATPQPAASSILEHRTQPLAGILDELDFSDLQQDAPASGPEIHSMEDPSSLPNASSPLADAAARLDTSERDTGPIPPPPPVVAPRDTGPIPPLPSTTSERDTGPIPPPPPVVAPRDTGPIPPPPQLAIESELPPPVAIARTSVEQEADQDTSQIASSPAIPTPGQVSDRSELPPPRVGPPAFAAEPDVRHVVLGFRDGTAVFLEADHPLFGLFFQWSELVAGPSMPEKLFARPRRGPDMFVGRPPRGRVT